MTTKSTQEQLEFALNSKVLEMSNGERVLTKVRAFFLVFGCILIAGCSQYLFDRADSIRRTAIEAGWKEVRFSTDKFVIIGFNKQSVGSNESVNIYIEGDGFAFKNNRRPSSDPTPLTATALEMALQDPSPNILYLARPCQMTRSKDRKNCVTAFWTRARFHEAVISSLNSAINAYIAGTNIKRLNLIGYSGGGAVAALIAVRRRDVNKLVTVAGTMDHKTWTEHHEVSPLRDSLNPLNYAKQLKTIRQFHFTGAEDERMPRFIIDRYMKSLGPNHRAEVIEVPGATHTCCWVEKWPELLSKVNRSM